MLPTGTFEFSQMTPSPILNEFPFRTSEMPQKYKFSDIAMSESETISNVEEEILRYRQGTATVGGSLLFPLEKNMYNHLFIHKGFGFFFSLKFTDIKSLLFFFTLPYRPLNFKSLPK